MLEHGYRHGIVGRVCRDVLTSVLKWLETLTTEGKSNSNLAGKESDKEPSISAAELKDALKEAVRQLYALCFFTSVPHKELGFQQFLLSL